MDRPRLTKLITLKRIKSDAPTDAAGEVDLTKAESWETLGQRRGDCKEEGTNESNGDSQQLATSAWSIKCRGDNVTANLNHRDRVEFHHRGRTVVIELTAPPRTIHDVPHWIMLEGVERR